MQKFNVTGMSCAACVTRVEKAVKAVNGVESCAVSLLTNSMNVDGNVAAATIVAAVINAGYGASVAGESAHRDIHEELLKDRETPILRRRLIASLVFLLPLLYFSMGHMMFDWPLPNWFTIPEKNHVAMGLVQLILSGIVLVINQKFFISGFKGILHRAPNMDSLVALGSSASYIYSIVVLFAMTRDQMLGGVEGAETWMDNFYFEGAATIVTLITVGKLLESISKGRTTSALKSLMKLAPRTATIVEQSEDAEVEKIVSIEQVKVDSIFLVKPGETIPVDGFILEGSSAINEAVITGESLPVDKTVGDLVTSATLNQSGFLKCKATRVGEDTTLSQIIKMVSDAAATKAPISKIADQVAGIFVPTVIGISIITFAVWFFIGVEIGFSLARAIAVLVISCPCALGLATPVAIMVGNGMGAKNGILFKTSAALESTGKIQIAVLDKTGTITQGEPKVTEIIAAPGITSTELLGIAKSVEAKSEHPLAKAIVNEAFVANSTVANLEVETFEALPGNGLKALLKDGREVLAGNLKFISSKVSVSREIQEKVDALASKGETPLLFTCNNQPLGIISVADVVKHDSAQAVAELKNQGLHVVMLTGDNQRTAATIASQVGVDEVVSDVLPGDKESVIRKLQEYGKVMMVGDGINDAPALTRADVGVAIGAGTDVAMDAADVVLMKNSLLDIAAAIRLSRRSIRNIRENLFWAFIYNVIGIPLAAGCYYKLFGWSLNASFAALAMSLSSFCVITNALRLNLVNVHDPKKDRKLKNAVAGALVANTNATATGKDSKDNRDIADNAHAESFPQTVTYSVEGMMCSHCEAAVKNALEEIEGIDSATASHKAGTVEVVFTKEVPLDLLKEALSKEDYILKD